MKPPPANPSTRLARRVIDGLVGFGVHEVVLAPGSRNAPLAFAAWDAMRTDRLRLHTRIDERTAGFLAMGMSKNGSHAAVMCTSGTAVANLHPAVLEAAHAGIPLVVVTADRPAPVRGTGASQTTDQAGIFGDAADNFDIATEDDFEEAREVLATLDQSCRPVHLNVQFAPPLTPDAAWEGRRGEPDRPRARRREPMPMQQEIAQGPRTVVVAGDDAGPRARILAESAGWPLLAEPSSGSRNGDNVIRTYRLLLDGGLGQRVERVVVAGHPTLSRPVTRLLEREDVEIVSVVSRGRWVTRPFPVDMEVEALAVAGEPDPAWLEEWVVTDRDMAQRLDGLLASEPGLTPYEVAAAVHRVVPPTGLLLVGASSPVRDLDLMARPYPVGERRKVIANRGLAGIDGTLSTAVGAALVRDSERSLAVVGDVTFLHDTNGLVLGPGEAEPDLTVVVVNDDGGSIFAMLEQGDEAFGSSYEKLFGTPHGVDIGSLCAATRTPHLKVTSLVELEQALATPNGGIEVIEAVVRRDNRRDLDERIRQLAVEG